MTDDAWDTPLGQWALAWMRYGRGEVAPVAPPVADPAEVCDDELAADAAVGVMPAPLVVYGDPKADA